MALTGPGIINEGAYDSFGYEDKEGQKTSLSTEDLHVATNPPETASVGLAALRKFFSVANRRLNDLVDVAELPCALGLVLYGAICFIAMDLTALGKTTLMKLVLNTAKKDWRATHEVGEDEDESVPCPGRLLSRPYSSRPARTTNLRRSAVPTHKG